MKKRTDTSTPLDFDILIVYDGTIAMSANDRSYTERAPFSRQCEEYNCKRSYEYFLQQCRKSSVRAAFTTTHDSSGPGEFSSIWTFNKTWKRVRHSARTNFIFDKFSPGEIHDRILLARLSQNLKGLRFFHNQKIREIFDDKLMTYTVFPQYVVPTTKVGLLTSRNVIAAQRKLRGDFTKGFVLKDQFGYGGTNVFLVKSNGQLPVLTKKNKSVSFVLQPYIEASGFRFGTYVGNIDLRVVVCNGQIIQCYIRIPKKGEFRANASQGGKVVYINIQDIPKDVMAMFKAVNATLPSRHAFYALDFIKSDTGHLYLLEGNITPGLNWFNTKDEYYTKALIRLIIQNISLVA